MLFTYIIVIGYLSSILSSPVNSLPMTQKSLLEVPLEKWSSDGLLKKFYGPFLWMGFNCLKAT